MLKKKNEKSNLEKKRVLFFEMGLMISLALLLVAFESGNEISNDLNLLADLAPSESDEIVMPIIRSRTEKPKPPIAPVELIIIDDDDDIEDVDIESMEVYETTEFELIPFETDEDEKAGKEVFRLVQKMPRYRKRDASLFQKHLQQLVVYPGEAQDAGIQGKVFLEFVVDENGDIINQNIVKSPDPLLSEAVLAAVKKTDKWQPGEQRGIKVRVLFTVPVFFKLH